MFNYKIKFTKKTNAGEISDKAAFDMIDDYWRTLCDDGQALGGFDVFSDGGFIYLTTVLPTKESLSDVYNNKYVKERFEKLIGFFEVEFFQEGENLEYRKSCNCGKPSWYFLYNEENNGESPLVCGDCRKPVPLYKVPCIFNEEGHRSVLSWQRAKNAMDELWYHGLWDRFTYGETVLHKSKINREGRRVCKELEKGLGAPVYYFIYFLCEPFGEGMTTPKGLPHDIPKVCPQCGGVWIDDTEFCKCEKCRLIVDSPGFATNKDKN
jgi:predicted  nucleic acid-binding Zn ribbon protein